MNPFAGKSSTERNKMIAAIVLGVLSLGSLFFAFGGQSIFSSGVKVTVTASPTPKPAAAVPLNPDNLKIPSQAEQDFTNTTTPVPQLASYSVPEPGRNIFAFYEPPRPCRQGVDLDCPTPVPTPPVTPTPTPTPHMMIATVNPQSVYAGSRGFRLELMGERMQADARVYLSQSELRTTFINEGRLVADVPAEFIATEGTRTILVQTIDGKKHL